jgi:hypothetical protein
VRLSRHYYVRVAGNDYSVHPTTIAGSSRPTPAWTRSSTLSSGQPPSALLANDPSINSGIGDKLTTCHRRPKELVHQRNHGIRELHFVSQVVGNRMRDQTRRAMEQQDPDALTEQ